MNTSTQMAKAIVLGALVAAFAAPVTQAGTKLPAASGAPATHTSGIVDDYFRAQRAAVAQPAVADDYFRDRPQALPDVFERYVAAHPNGRGLDLAYPDAFERAVIRGPSAYLVPSVSQAGSGGLNWGDAGIGAASGFVLALALVGLGLGVLRRRMGETKTGKAATVPS